MSEQELIIKKSFAECEKKIKERGIELRAEWVANFNKSKKSAMEKILDSEYMNYVYDCEPSSRIRKQLFHLT